MNITTESPLALPEEAPAPHEITVIVTRSAGKDGAYLVMIDTNFEPSGDDGSPGLRVLVNDGNVLNASGVDGDHTAAKGGVDFEGREDGRMHQYTDQTLTVDMSTVVDTGLVD